jgi:polygalacturonase
MKICIPRRAVRSLLYQALKLVECNNLELSFFSSKDSPRMHVSILKSRYVTVKQLTIVAPGNSPNTDGIHVGQSENVQITDSTIGTGDDCVSIASGSRFVTVHGITCGPGHGVRSGNRRCS